MEFKTFVFYLLAAILIFASLRVITARNPVHSALYLVLAFFNAAGLWLLLEAEFLALALILVYVGAVMVLFLFVVMMLDVNFDKLRSKFSNYIFPAATVGILIFVQMALVLWSRAMNPAGTPASAPAGYSNTKTLGRLIYTEYVYPFEIAAVILLVAIVAAIALTLRRRKGTKYQNPAQQINVRREQRVRLVSMPAEPKE